MIDRYTKTVLTVIAAALVYLCVAVTAFPAVQAQSTARPGESTGPQEVVVVGWRPNTPLPIVAPEPLRVITEQQPGVKDRVVLVGWEETNVRGKFERTLDLRSDGVPVSARTR